MGVGKWEVMVTKGRNEEVRKLGFSIAKVPDLGDITIFIDFWKWGIEIIIWRLNDESEEDRTREGSRHR